MDDVRSGRCDQPLTFVDWFGVFDPILTFDCFKNNNHLRFELTFSLLSPLGCHAP